MQNVLTIQYTIMFYTNINHKLVLLMFIFRYRALSITARTVSRYPRALIAANRKRGVAGGLYVYVLKVLPGLESSKHSLCLPETVK